MYANRCTVWIIKCLRDGSTDQQIDWRTDSTGWTEYLDRFDLLETSKAWRLLPIKLKDKKTRPDTRPPVSDGWAGADMRVFALFDSCSPTDRPTDGPTDRPTDRRTDKASYRVACPQLISKIDSIISYHDNFWSSWATILWRYSIDRLFKALQTLIDFF